ncbi:NAD+ synthase [Deltaproteobacteria bacterium]|nr:NAD+ synthase [Deltaproteobacteria bacterium]
MRVIVAQLAPVVGDVAANAHRCVAAIRQGIAMGARLVVMPELVISGYPPRDLLDRADLIEACMREAHRVAAATSGSSTIAVFGCPWQEGGLRNSGVVAFNGAIVAVRHKSLLPTYDVFDESRYFTPETDPRPVLVDGLTLGVTICEDIWNEPGLVRHGYRLDPVEHLRGCDVLVNLSASPFHAGKGALRAGLVQAQARQVGAPLVYCNQVGGNDELLFDGASLVATADGRLIHQGRQFVEETVTVDLGGPEIVPHFPAFEDEVLDALVMGTRDYAERTGFRSAVLGLSGGIDSALVAVIAARALGPQNVLGVGMPGPFSSPGSITDARALAANVGMPFELVPITAANDAILAALGPIFMGKARDITEENLQARVRGTVLMAISNKFAHLLLTTGNKSEMAVGYCTLYGDMNGGLGLIGDVFKTDVYRLSQRCNARGEVIPTSTLKKAPSAELAPNQTDQDSLPPYAVLDAILRLYVEAVTDTESIVAQGYDRATVERVVKLVVRSEFKRWQAAPVLRVSSRAFGCGRRMPLAQRWR